MATSDTTLFHNPNCSTSRNALALLRERGIEPEVVLYLKTPPDRARLRALATATGEPVRALLRQKEALYTELGLDDPKWHDDQLLDFIVQHPVLLNRPVVQTPQGARVARPVERLLEILPTR